MPLFLAATIVGGGVFPAQRAWQSLRRGSLDINVLMVVAVAGAVAIREFEEAAMVVSLFAAAQWLEAQSLNGASQAIGKLIGLAPTERAGPENAAGERRVAIEQVPPGSLMIVHARAKKIRARWHRPQRPLRCQPGADYRRGAAGGKRSRGRVFAGTINGHGALTVAVTAARGRRRWRDRATGRTAEAQRAPLQLCIDRFAREVHAVGRDSRGAGRDRAGRCCSRQPFDVWLYRALVLLVVSCPCALVISTPVSIVAALAGAAQQGVLIKGGIHLERLARVRVDRVRQDRHASPPAA